MTIRKLLIRTAAALLLAIGPAMAKDLDWMRHGQPGSDNPIVVTPGEPTRELPGPLTYEQMARSPQKYLTDLSSFSVKSFR